MNWNTQHKKHLAIRFLFVFLLLWWAGSASAQSPPATFQEDEKGFFDILRQEPKTSLQKRSRESKGLPQKGVDDPKGPEAVVNDYQKLTQNPTARSLILFDFDSAVIKKGSYSILKNLANVLSNQLPTITLIVAGHTDSVGSADYNSGLSHRRAQAVKDFLVSAYDIQPTRLYIEGYGEHEPLTTNNTPQGRAQNRRVEFIRVE